MCLHCAFQCQGRAGGCGCGCGCGCRCCCRCRCRCGCGCGCGCGCAVRVCNVPECRGQGGPDVGTLAGPPAAGAGGRRRGGAVAGGPAGHRSCPPGRDPAGACAVREHDAQVGGAGLSSLRADSQASSAHAPSAMCGFFIFAHRQARGKGPSETLKGVDGPFPLPASRRRPHPKRQPFAGGAAETAVAGWVGRSPRARRGGAWHFVFYASVRGWLWLRLCFRLSLRLWLWLWLCGQGAQRSGMPRARRTGRWHPGGTTCRSSGGRRRGGAVAPVPVGRPQYMAVASTAVYLSSRHAALGGRK